MNVREHVLNILVRDGQWIGACNCGWEASGDLDVLDRWQEHTQGVAFPPK